MEYLPFHIYLPSYLILQLTHLLRYIHWTNLLFFLVEHVERALGICYDFQS